MKPPFVAQMALALLCVGISLECRASAPNEDHLVPLKEAYGSSAAYQEAWQRQLLVTPGDVARFVSLPGTGDVETAVSIYRQPGTSNSLPGVDYWVTVTQASKSLWKAVESKIDPATVHIQRCDVQISESTAQAVHEAWIAMLTQTKARQTSGISVDSSQEVFSAAKPDGVILEGESSSTPKQNTKALIDIALSFMEYCEAPVAKRVQIMSKIEKTVSNLLDRIGSSSGRKN